MKINRSPNKFLIVLGIAACFLGLCFYCAIPDYNFIFHRDNITITDATIYRTKIERRDFKYYYQFPFKGGAYTGALSSPLPLYPVYGKDKTVKIFFYNDLPEDNNSMVGFVFFNCLLVLGLYGLFALYRKMVRINWISSDYNTDDLKAGSAFDETLSADGQNFQKISVKKMKIKNSTLFSLFRPLNEVSVEEKVFYKVIDKSTGHTESGMISDPEALEKFINEVKNKRKELDD